MNERDDGFLSRWSRRKALVRQGVEPPPAPDPAPAAAAVAPTPSAPRTAAADTPAGHAPDEHPAGASPAAGAAPVAAPANPAPPKPTLDDVAALTPESDFSRFVAHDVDPQVRNSALKKLFSDPHYNVMDGLDIYIDDYNTPDPLPKSMLRQMVQARMLGLLDDEMPEQPASSAAPAAPPASLAHAGRTVEVEVEVEAGAGPEAANDAPQEGTGTPVGDAPAAALPPPEDTPALGLVPEAGVEGKAKAKADGAGESWMRPVAGEPQAAAPGPGAASSGS